MALALAVPAFAIEESEVEAAVNATSREEVTGNVLIWFLCAVAFLKVSQKIDSFMSSIGVNVGHTGRFHAGRGNGSSQRHFRSYRSYG